MVRSSTDEGASNGDEEHDEEDGVDEEEFEGFKDGGVVLPANIGDLDDFARPDSNSRSEVDDQDDESSEEGEETSEALLDGAKEA